MARALAWHARGHRFDPDILHTAPERGRTIYDMLDNTNLKCGTLMPHPSKTKQIAEKEGRARN